MGELHGFDDVIQPVDTRAIPVEDSHALAPARAVEVLASHTSADVVELPTAKIGTWELRLYKWRLIARIYDLIKQLQHFLKGEHMNTDLKTTVSGFFASICALLAIFHIAVPDIVSQVGAVIGVALLSFFANKKDAPKP